MPLQRPDQVLASSRSPFACKGGMKYFPLPFRSLMVAISLVAAAVVSAGAIEGNQIESALRAYPVLRDAAGQKIADGNFAQWVENDGLHVQITYTGNGRQIEETAVLRQRPELSQSKWRWHELSGGQDVRTFEVD